MEMMIYGKYRYCLVTLQHCKWTSTTCFKECGCRHVFAAKIHCRQYVFCVEIRWRITSMPTLRLGGGLRKAIEEEQVCSSLSTKIRLPDEIVVGAEALIRWSHPELGMISPDQFIPWQKRVVDYSSGWMGYLAEACRQLAKSGEKRVIVPIKLSVNLSSRPIYASRFSRYGFSALLEKTGWILSFFELWVNRKACLMVMLQPIDWKSCMFS